MSDPREPGVIRVLGEHGEVLAELPFTATSTRAWHDWVDPQRLRVKRVEAELNGIAEYNAALRREVATQWWSNHGEHCSTEWPHREGGYCHWPLPEVLSESDIPQEWHTGPWPPNPLLQYFQPVPPEEIPADLFTCGLCGATLPLAGNMPVEHDCTTGYVGPAD